MYIHWLSPSVCMRNVNSACLWAWWFACKIKRIYFVLLCWITTQHIKWNITGSLQIFIPILLQKVVRQMPHLPHRVRWLCSRGKCARVLVVWIDLHYVLLISLLTPLCPWPLCLFHLVLCPSHLCLCSSHLSLCPWSSHTQIIATNTFLNFSSGKRTLSAQGSFTWWES